MARVALSYLARKNSKQEVARGEPLTTDFEMVWEVGEKLLLEKKLKEWPGKWLEELLGKWLEEGNWEWR